MDKEVFGIISAAIGIVGAIPYIYYSYKKKTKPQRFAWLIFLILSLISFSSQLALGARASLFLVGWTVINNIIIFSLSMRKNGGIGAINRVNVAAFLLAIISIILWKTTNSPFIALMCMIVADGIGALLIVVKSYQHPETETAIMWSLGIFAGIFSILAVGEFNIGLLAYPVYIAVLNAAIVTAILLGKKMHSVKK